MPKASLVIRTKNEARFLRATLEAVRRQSFTDHEVVVVDSGSTDETLAIASDLGARIVTMEPADFTYGRASNLGCARASGELLVLLSAHALPAHEGWLQALLRPFDDGVVAGVSGRELPRPDCNPFDRRGLLHRYNGAPAGEIRLDARFYALVFTAANGAIRRSVWESIAFDEDLPFAEDWDWGRRAIAAGHRLWYAPDAAVYHSHNESLGELRRRCCNQAAAERRLGLVPRRNRGSRVLFDATVIGAFDTVYAALGLSHPRWIVSALPRRVVASAGRYAGYRGIAPEMSVLGAVCGRPIVELVRKGNRFLSDLSPRLVKWTGKSRHAIHPKHLEPARVDRDWFLAHLEPEARVLDAGCGHGAHAITSAKHGASVLGFDGSVAELRTALARSRDAPNGDRRLGFIRANAEEPFPLADGAFDLVLALDILEHLEARDRFLSECRRVLRPGGRLLVAVPNRDTSWRRRLRLLGLDSRSDPDHEVEYTRSELEDELARAGFGVEQVAPVVYDTPWYGLIDLAGGVSIGLYRSLSRWKRQAAIEHPEESNGFRVVARAT